MRRNGSETGTLVGALFLAWASASAVAEQTHIAAGMQNVREDIEPPVASCTRDQAQASEPPEYTRVAEIDPDLSCAMAPREVVRRLKSPDTLLIDTRKATDFANFHINGAMNLSAAELRSKRFLRRKSVMLIGDGKSERQQYIDCKKLKSRGFEKVGVLRGGMPAWLAAGQKVLGRPPDPAQLARLTPSELWTESRFGANLVLVAAGRKALQKQLPGSAALPDANPQTIKAAVGKHRKRSKSAALAAVVLAADEGTDFQPLSRAVDPVPLLIYSETAEAFTRQLEQQAAVWTAQARGPKRPLRCGAH